jgi:ferredoxin
MTYIVNDKCIKCKEMDCVEVCPVDCFYEGENMLVIKPDECIDCGVCEPECPVDAITTDTVEGANEWVTLNTKYSELWPNITKKREEDVPEDHEKWKNVENKLQYLSEKPGKGD